VTKDIEIIELWWKEMEEVYDLVKFKFGLKDSRVGNGSGRGFPLL
jgi:hypothetical protein